jgi:bifunctional ADP-heptose synthase (sugar kinase/adenylyltransferase)
MAATHREQGQRITLAIGRFDVLDASVVSMLEAATNHADAVIACVLGDAGAPPGAHVFGSDSRARMLGTLPWVDYVVLVAHRNFERFVQKLRPDRTITADASSARQIAERTNDNDAKARSDQP